MVLSNGLGVSCELRCTYCLKHEALSAARQLHALVRPPVRQAESLTRAVLPAENDLMTLGAEVV